MNNLLLCEVKTPVLTLCLTSLLNSNLEMSQVVSDMCLCIFQCVPNSRHLPLATISVVKDHPEMTDWVHSKDDSAPFYISSNIYTKIVVDRVQAADQRTYNVLFLSTGTVKCMQFTTLFCCCLQSVLSWLFGRALFTISADNSGLRIKLRSLPKRFLKQMCAVFEDTGKIHKVLEAGSKPFIISETQISSQSSIQSMNLHSKKVEKIFSSANCLENRALLSGALLPTSVPQRKYLFFTGLLQFFSIWINYYIWSAQLDIISVFGPLFIVKVLFWFHCPVFINIVFGCSRK